VAQAYSLWVLVAAEIDPASTNPHRLEACATEQTRQAQSLSYWVLKFIGKSCASRDRPEDILG
jgi:hypothetical protein